LDVDGSDRSANLLSMVSWLRLALWGEGRARSGAGENGEGVDFGVFE